MTHRISGPGISASTIIAAVEPRLRRSWRVQCIPSVCMSGCLDALGKTANMAAHSASKVSGVSNDDPQSGSLASPPGKYC